MSAPVASLLNSLAALSVAISLATAALLARSSAMKAVLCNLAALAFACAIIVGYLSHRQLRETAIEIIEPQPWIHPDPVLGYRPSANGVFRFRKLIGNQTIYDVKVSTGPEGWRVTPPAPAATRSLLFFGCSFTFGAGLNDEQSFPYRVALKTQGRYEVHNFGQNAWGPHNMQAMLDHHVLDPVVQRPPELAVFLLIPDHMARIEGLSPYSDNFPRYVLNSSGQAVAAGTFAGTLTPVNRTLRRLNMGGWVKTVGLPAWRPFAGHTDQLLLALMRSARDQIQLRYPGCRFEVILWGDSDRWVSSDWARSLEAGLRAEGIPAHKAEEFLPNLRTNKDRYRISPLEHHPNALAADLMADYIVHQLLAQ